MTDFILYGAYGYTGKLITRMAADYGLTPLLCRRNETKLAELSAASGFPYWAVDLDDEEALKDVLQQAPVVLHTAGPFIQTADRMMDACLSTSTHYLDITGEIKVEHCLASKNVGCVQERPLLADNKIKIIALCHTTCLRPLERVPIFRILSKLKIGIA